MKQKPTLRAAAQKLARTAMAATMAAAAMVATALVATTALTACHNDPVADLNAPDAPNAGATITLTATMPTPAQTRVAYGEDNLLGAAHLRWQAGDRLQVTSSEGNAQTFVLNPGDEGHSAARFTGTVPAGTSPYTVTYQRTPDATATATTPGSDLGNPGAPITPAPPAADASIADLGAATAAHQQQAANGDYAHLDRYLALTGTVAGTLSSAPQIQLSLATTLLKLQLTALPTIVTSTRVGTLRWSVQPDADSPQRTLSITLGINANPADGNPANAGIEIDPANRTLTAYIAFLPGQMKLRPGGEFTVTLGDANGKPLCIATALNPSATTAKVYAAGTRVVAPMGAAPQPLWKGMAVATGLQPLDKTVFNAQNPVWILTGGGDGGAVDQKVCGNAAGATFNAGSNIELTLTGVKTVVESIFNYSSGLASVSLPAATSIGYGAFYGCTALVAVSAPAATSIGKNAFWDCTALSAVSAPAATSIGERAFYGCEALTAISLPLAKEIGNTAFAACSALATVNLPAATNIGQRAFAGCKALTHLELLAAGDITLDADAFGFFDTAPACTLILHPNKAPGAAGAATPKASANGKWGAADAEVQWKQILHSGINLPPLGEDDGMPQ